jgi:hypothetical protein
MAQQFSKNPEKGDEHLKSPERPDKSLTHEKSGAKEIHEKSKEFVEGVSEVVEGVEMAESADSNVGEKAGEGKNRSPASGMKSAGTTSTTTTQTAEPTIEVMQIQIATQVKKEIRLLEKEASKIMSSGQFAPYKLNGIIAKIRELKDILANMAYAAAETIKDWWVRFVKGITT